jgi:hypothetical protein
MGRSQAKEFIALPIPSAGCFRTYSCNAKQDMITDARCKVAHRQIQYFDEMKSFSRRRSNVFRRLRKMALDREDLNKPA